MNIKHYNEFLEYQDKGLKKQAGKSVRMFISTFQNEDEIKEWVLQYLPSLTTNRSSRIRHEIFHELVYPVLKAGYVDNDFVSTLWLGKLIQNVYQATRLHEELSWVSELQLFRKCYEQKPEDDEARLLCLKTLVDWLEYSEHEWPSGILYGNDGATLEQCGEILREIEIILKLDKEYKYSDFIKQYSKKLVQYKTRLNQ